MKGLIALIEDGEKGLLDTIKMGKKNFYGKDNVIHVENGSC